jgi:hypothetical protein
MKTIDIIAGACPNFMKIAPIIDAPKAAQLAGVHCAIACPMLIPIIC